MEEKGVFLRVIMLGIIFFVVIRAPYVKAWRNLCLEDGEGNEFYSIECIFIDVYTQKGGMGRGIQGGVFEPQENIVLYVKVANITAPVPNIEVLFEVYGPMNPYENFSMARYAITNESGIASTSFKIPIFAEHYEEVTFGIWSVSARVALEEKIICDSLTFEVGWIADIISVVTGTFLDEVYWIPRANFTKEESMDVKLMVKNIAFTQKNAWFGIVCIDKEDIPIAWVLKNFTLPGKTTEELFFHIPCIPHWASVGKAMTYATAYDGLPWEGGVPYCPEKSAKSLIMEGIEDATSPSIGKAFHEPEVVQPDQEVIVSVNVTDSESDVQEVIVCYCVDDSSTWVNVKMNKTVGDMFVGSISGFPAGTNVRYVVIAYDYAGNFAVDNNVGQYYVLKVIAEFSSIHILLLVIVFTTISIVIAKKKLPSLLT